jgi:hypothetical protein
MRWTRGLWKPILTQLIFRQVPILEKWMKEKPSYLIMCLALAVYLTACANQPRPEQRYTADWVRPEWSPFSGRQGVSPYNATFSLADVTFRLSGSAAIDAHQGNRFALTVVVPSGKTIKFRSRTFSAKDLSTGKIYLASIDQITGVFVNAKVSVKYNEKEVSKGDFLDPLIGETVEQKIGLFDRSQYWGTGSSYQPIGINKTFRATGQFPDMHSTAFELQPPDFDMAGVTYAFPPVRFMKTVGVPNQDEGLDYSE